MRWHAPLTHHSNCPRRKLDQQNCHQPLLGLCVVEAIISGCASNDFCALLGEAFIELTGGIAEVIRI